MPKRIPAWISLALVIAVTLLHGCDQPASKKKSANVPMPPPAPPPALPAPPPPSVDNLPQVATQDDAEKQLPPNTEAVTAGVGVGIKGRSLDGYKGAVVTPAKSFFAAREKIAFEIQVPHALQLYKAENGEGPKSHDEFMERIVKPNGIKLPELPPGHVYEYQPATEELLVIRPKKG